MRILHSADIKSASLVSVHDVPSDNFTTPVPSTPDDGTLYQYVFDGNPLSLMCSGFTTFVHISCPNFV
jgi:hypothetical protein